MTTTTSREIDSAHPCNLKLVNAHDNAFDYATTELKMANDDADSYATKVHIEWAVADEDSCGCMECAR